VPTMSGLLPLPSPLRERADHGIVSIKTRGGSIRSHPWFHTYRLSLGLVPVGDVPVVILEWAEGEIVGVEAV
jgi:hypothetical protein